MAATVVSFGEWLPDQPEMGNPGLTIAKNVMPKDGGYVQFSPVSGSTLTNSTAPAHPQGAIWARDPLSLGAVLYVGNQTALSVSTTGAFTNISSGVYALPSLATVWDFAQFDNLIVATVGDHRPQAHTIGASTNFSTLSTSGEAPYARRVGVMGQFLMLAQTRQTTTASVDIDIRWSAVGQPRNWPTPNSATAIAAQSGQQFLNQKHGPVMGVDATDQFGVVFQQDALTRITYAGPPVVFQFDKISDQVGCAFPNSIVQLYGKFYFISRSGVCVTDGVSVTNISDEKVSEWLFANNVFSYGTEYVHGAADPIRQVIMWGFPLSSSGGAFPKIVLVYNYLENRFSWAQNDHYVILPYGDNNVHEYGRITAFDSTFKVGFFAGTAGAATLATGDLELNPGGRAYVDGVKPNIESSGTAPAVTVRIGSRSDLATTPSYTATTTPTTRTGFADFRVDAKYHRAEVQIVGNFEKAVGIEFKAQPTGET